LILEKGESMEEIKNKLVGTFINSKSFGFVVPDDKKFGSDIFISKSNFGKARNNHKVVVEIIKQAMDDLKQNGNTVLTTYYRTIDAMQK
jgi:ribonuclease R